MKHKQDEEGGSASENTSNIHTGVSDGIIETEGMSGIHSFLVKIEDDSEEEDGFVEEEEV